MPNDRNASEAPQSPLGRLLSIVNSAAKRVPVVKFAYGLIGIAAAGSSISLILGSNKNAVIVVGLTFIGAVLLFIFARLAASNDPMVQKAGQFLIWVIVSFFSAFLLLTTTAFTAYWPEPWARFLGIQTTINRAACERDVNVLNMMWNNDSIQTEDVLRQADKVQLCDPLQAANARGSVAFYNGDYGNAAAQFGVAARLDPSDDVVNRNLADADIMVGLYKEAEAALQRINARGNLWNYKYAKVKFYTGAPAEAFEIAASVPTQMHDDGNLTGRARILQAASLLDQAKGQTDMQLAQTIDSAKILFLEGYNSNRNRWSEILSTGCSTRNEGFKKECSALQAYWRAWADQAK